MFEYAVGEVGLKPHEFYCLTYYEYSCVLSGYLIRTMRTWENTRAIEWMLLRVNSGKDFKLTPQDIRPLLTDKAKETRVVSAQEKQDLSEMAVQRAALIPVDKLMKKR